jgi:hypothetical protein
MKEQRLGSMKMGNVRREGRLTIRWQIKKMGRYGKDDRQN